MPSAAKKLSIVHNDEPIQEPVQEAANDTPQEVAQELVQELVEELEVVEVTVSADAPQPGERPEELRLLEALLFAADGPLDEATLKRPLPDGVDLKAALAMLQAEYATRGVNLVRIGKKWTFRTAGDRGC